LDLDNQEDSSIITQPELPDLTGLPPAQIYKKTLEFEPKEFQKELVKAHWQLLESCIAKPRKKDNRLSFDPIEEIYYNFGIWCGEQFREDLEVREAKELHSQLSDAEFYQQVFEALVEELLNYQPKPPFITLTQWLKKRDETYLLMAEMERFSIPKEVLLQLPDDAKEYLIARKERLGLLKKLEPKIKLLPGVHNKFLQLILSGNLHDRIDLLKIQSFLSGEDKNTLEKMSKMWSSIEKQLSSIFKDQETLDAVAQIHELNDDIVEFSKTQHINFDEVFKAARELFLTVGNSYRRLTRDVQMMRNTLNISSIKCKYGAHNPMPSTWPKPINTEVLSKYKEKSLHLDKSFLSESEVLLAPGNFNGFYEFDRGTLILPICSEDAAFQWITCMVQFRLTIETLKESSTFISDLKDVDSGSSPQKTFHRLYTDWLEKGNNEGFFEFSKIEQTFLLKHVAPSLQTLFLRDEEYFINAYKKEQMLADWKAGKLKGDGMRKVAGFLFQEKKLKESAMVLKKLSSAKSMNPACDIPLIKVLLELNERQEALILLKKYLDAKNLGYYQIYAQNILAKLKAKS
jgi:hypothetical protein